MATGTNARRWEQRNALHIMSLRQLKGHHRVETSGAIEKERVRPRRRQVARCAAGNRQCVRRNTTPETQHTHRTRNPKQHTTHARNPAQHTAVTRVHAQPNTRQIALCEKLLGGHFSSQNH